MKHLMGINLASKEVSDANTLAAPESHDAIFSCMINDERQSTVMRGFSKRLDPILCTAVGFENGVDTGDIKLNDICSHIDTTVS